MSESEKSNLDVMVLDIADHIPSTLGYCDKNQVCRYANKAYLEWFGKSPEEVVGGTIIELLGPKLYELNLPFIKKVLAGQKQVFERKIMLPSGEIRDAIITYLPDIDGKEVKGFFAHTVDVTLSKKKSAELVATVRAKDKEVLRSAIDVHEKERDAIAVALRDGINQTFACSKLMLQSTRFSEENKPELRIIEKNIQKAISDLNALSTSLSHSAITLLGLKNGLRGFIDNYSSQYNHRVQLVLDSEELEELCLDDKISIFRMVQNFLQLMAEETVSREILIKLSYIPSRISLLLAHDDLEYVADETSIHYVNIQNRVSYYDGVLNENCESGQYKMEIALHLTLAENTTYQHSDTL